MKALYKRKKKLVQELLDLGRELDSKIEERWGFHYSQTDDDSCIDTLDYGTQDLEYSDFVEKMNEYKKEVERGDRRLQA